MLIQDFPVRVRVTFRMTLDASRVGTAPSRQLEHTFEPGSLPLAHMPITGDYIFLAGEQMYVQRREISSELVHLYCECLVPTQPAYADGEPAYLDAVVASARENGLG